MNREHSRAASRLRARLALGVAATLAIACGKTETVAPTASPIAAIAPEKIFFGEVFLGSSVTRAFTITNVGTGTLVGSFSRANCTEPGALYGPGWYAVGSTSYELTAGASKTVEIRFEPFIAEGH